MLFQNILLTTINAIGFIFFVLLFWTLPGSLIFKKNAKILKIDQIVLATIFGFSLYSLLIFIIRLSNLPFWIGYIPFFCLALYKLKSFKVKQLSIRKFSSAQKVFLIIAVFGLLIQGIVLFKSAISDNEGLKFLEISAHDSLQHVYLINELKENFPPRQPSFAPAIVKNYHFLLDLTIASIGKYLPFSTFELYFRIIPTFTSLLLSLSVFIFTRRLTNSEWLANVAVFLTLFSGNAAWFVKLFRGEEFTVSANTFMLDPIIDLMQNPIAVIVFPLMLAGITGLMLLERARDIRWILLASLTFGVMIGFKAWGGALMIITLPVFALFLSLKKKRHEGWLLWPITLVITLILFLPIYEHQTAANLVFVPGWLLKRMVEDPDRFNFQKYYFLEQYYKETGNMLRLVQINAVEVLIYIFGNLWMKALGLVFIIGSLRKLSPSRAFKIVVVVTSLSLPLLFNQGRKAYDIIQFGPYALLLMAIFTAVSLTYFEKYLPKRLMIFLILLILIISVPSNKKSVITRYKSDSFLVTNEELEAYSYLREETDPESILMVYPTQRNDAILLVAALTGRPTYYSGKSFAEISGENIRERDEKWRSFFRDIDPEKRGRVIREGSIDYIILTPDEDKQFNPAGLNLKKIFENNEMIIYRIV